MHFKVKATRAGQNADTTLISWLIVSQHTLRYPYTFHFKIILDIVDKFVCWSNLFNTIHIIEMSSHIMSYPIADFYKPTFVYMIIF